MIERVRKICLAYPGTIEKISHGAPTFFTPKRVFAMFSNNPDWDGHIGVWLPAGPGVQQELIAERPDTFYYPPYVGKGGWVGVELARIGDDELGALIDESYRLMTVKDKPAKKPK
jgi:hypothetical protein